MIIKSIQINDTKRFVWIVILCVVVILCFESIGLFEGINHYCYNLAFRLRGERDHNNQIIIAAIDEKTLAKLGRWPIRRSVYADLLKVLHEAAAVGFDIIFSEPSADDALLSHAITTDAKVVLPVYINSQFHVSYPVKAFSPAGLGHVHLEPGIDGFVRQVFHTISHQSMTIPSFASALYDVIGTRKNPRQDFAARVTQPKMADHIRQSDPMNINYYGAPGAFQYLSVVDILEGYWPPAFFAKKIIVVGSTAAGLHERMLVPFSQGRSRMPGAEVHAHILNNLLDKTSIQFVGRPIRWVFVIIFSTLCFFVFVRFGSLKGTLIWFLSLLTIIIIVFYLFTTFNIWLPPASVSLAVTAAFFLAYIFNLQRMRKLLLQAKVDWEESFNTIDDAITIHDINGNIIQANKAAEEFFGLPLLESLSERCFRLCHGTEGSCLETNALIKEQAITEEIFDPKLDRHFEIKSLPRFDHDDRCNGMVQVVRDMTEKKKAETENKMLQGQLVQAQKMEAIGTLAGGIAHDFNNILAVVMGYTELSLHDTPHHSPSRDKLQQVLKASLRAKELVGQILMFSRQTVQEQQPQPVQIGLFIKEALKLLRSTLPSTIHIRQHIASQGLAVIDPTQMHQIIMNLCTNANHAMQENGGILSVELHEVNIAPQSEVSGFMPDLQLGPYLRLIVSDTGCGMAPDIINRIFDPYFTTKEKEVGTGLGLATVHAIVHHHGGTITVESAVGTGSAFSVYLPRTVSAKQVSELAPAKPLPTGAEHVLFVDDEQDLVHIGQTLLQQLGYHVVPKHNSIDALHAFRVTPDRFDLVITDMTMPELTGEKLAQELIKIRPDIPVILCTGYSERINAQKAREIGINAFVMKPLTLSHLAETIREVLENKGQVTR